MSKDMWKDKLVKLVPASNVVAAEKKYNSSAKGPMKKPLSWALGPIGKIGKRMKRGK